MHPPIDAWDAAYLQSIATPDEEADLEKKGSALMDPSGNKKDTQEEWAKQTCAFANSGSGFLVYGIQKAGGLDGGVPAAVGNQGIKAWAEAMIPMLLHPPMNDCRAKFIQVAGHHDADRGALVVSIPLSEHRPHWITLHGKEVPYVRAGEHSCPMRLQTFLDISSRGSISVGEIESLGVVSGPASAQADWDQFSLNPVVRLLSGPICPVWAFELRVSPNRGRFLHETGEQFMLVQDERTVLFTEYVPLFPRRSTPVSVRPFRFQLRTLREMRETPIVATLWAGSAPPVEREFLAGELYPKS